MIRTQIYLYKHEQESLRHLTKKTGKNLSELIRHAIDAFLSPQNPQKRLQNLRAAMGMWSDHDINLPSLRKSWDRR